MFKSLMTLSLSLLIAVTFYFCIPNIAAEVDCYHSCDSTNVVCSADGDFCKFDVAACVVTCEGFVTFWVRPQGSPGLYNCVGGLNWDEAELCAPGPCRCYKNVFNGQFCDNYEYLTKCGDDVVDTGVFDCP